VRPGKTTEEISCILVCGTGTDQQVAHLHDSYMTKMIVDKLLSN